VFKKRPRTEGGAKGESAVIHPAAKTEARYWERRLFKNTFTYKGKRREVNGWSVKIQQFGRRKTFSLRASNPAAAAAEACQIYQLINAAGWEAAGQRFGRGGFSGITGSRSSANFESAPWESRLIHRKHPEPTEAREKKELSVRIQHMGISRYFPLGTADETKAAKVAREIHRFIINHGWTAAGQEFRRELTLALRWLDSPLAWTYTTMHTWKSGDPIPQSVELNSKSPSFQVAIIEPDAGIRYALAAGTNRQEGFRCCATWASPAEALREIIRLRVDLVLINYALPDQAGTSACEELQRRRNGLVGLLYSEFEDSDELFKATPGGALGYMLRRTSPHRLFEPIAQAAGPLTRELVALKLREYFQQVVAALPSGPSAVATAKLTPREHEILALLAKGHLAKEIADALGISIWTVHGHVKSVFEKLDVHTRTEAVVKFLQK